jgi:hypothetical protein
MNQPLDQPENDGALEGPPDEQALTRLRATDALELEHRPSLEEVNRELRMRADPGQVAPAGRLELPWSPEARARSRARDVSLEARLDLFKDNLRAIRIAREVLNRAATMRAVEAAETAIFEIRTAGETARLAIINEAHLEMTREFLDHLEVLEAFRPRVGAEILDALKERALNEFTARMNRASKADVEFAKNDILHLKP